MRTRVLEGLACSRCAAEPAVMVPDELFERVQLFRCADGYGCGESVQCKECGVIFAGGRTEARRALWEPFSTATQQALDHGPMVCPDCVKRVLAAVIDAFRARA